MEYNFDFIKKLTNNIGKLFGSKCEIIVHDFTNGYESTIVHVVNGEVSGRVIGGCPTNLFFEHLDDLAEKEEEFSSYFSTMPDGRLIKSSTTFLRNDAGEIVGSICINVDVSGLAAMSSAFRAFLDGEKSSSAQVGNEHFAKDVNDLMESYLAQVQENIGKSACDMNKKEKLAALAFLKDKGVLQIAKANVKLCEFFSISKFTLYNYLNEISENEKRENGGMNGQD